MPGDLLAISSLLPWQTHVQLSGTGDDTLYTVPGGELLIVKTAVVVNITNDPNLAGQAMSVLVSVSLVPSGGSIDGTHRLMSQYLLSPGDTLPVPGLDGAGDPLGPGDAITARADVAPGASSAAGAVNVILGGWLGS